MSSLLDLAPELIHLILLSLLDDNDALVNVCLAGNHGLLSVARPLCWKEFRLEGNVETDEQYLIERLKDLISDPDRTRAVRLLKINLSGYHDNVAPFFVELRQSVKKLVNVTHLHIDAFGMMQGFCYGPDIFVGNTVQGLPNVVSLVVEGCTSTGNFDKFPWLETVSTSLQHVSTRFCDGDLSALWLNCPSLNSLEMEGGDARQFWESHRSRRGDDYYGMTRISPANVSQDSHLCSFRTGRLFRCY